MWNSGRACRPTEIAGSANADGHWPVSHARGASPFELAFANGDRRASAHKPSEAPGCGFVQWGWRSLASDLPGPGFPRAPSSRAMPPQNAPGRARGWPPAGPRAPAQGAGRLNASARTSPGLRGRGRAAAEAPPAAAPGPELRYRQIRARRCQSRTLLLALVLNGRRA